jgi:TolA-binding protein
MKTRLFFFVFICCGAILQSCAYYNTFYNTKKNFREGLAENKKRVGDKPTAQEIQKFDATIEKASKVLQLYPTSKYADDAVLILGQSFFYKQEYLKAQRKFDELIANFPKSNLLPTARLWLAKTNIELRDYAGAERVVRELQKQPRRGGLNEEAQLLLGELYYRQGMYSLAAQEFEAASKELGDKTLRGRSLMRLGECYQKTGNTNGAVESFRLATSLGGDQDFKFQSSFQFAIALKEEKRYDDALKIFNSLLSEFPNYKDIPLVKVQIAGAYHGQGNVAEATRLYEQVIELHARTEAAAAAYFYRGEIYERNDGDYAKALESYEKVRKENVKSEKVGEAARRSKNLAELTKLNQTMADLEKQLQQMRSGETPGPAPTNDTTAAPRSRRSGAAKPAAPAGQPTVAGISAELAKTKIQIAQLFYFQFERLEAAIPVYREVAEHFPDSPHAPQALFTLAYIFENLNKRPAEADSIVRLLAEKYSASPQGAAARKKLGLAIADQSASAGSQPSEKADFLQAEKILFDQKEPARAVEAYQEFITKYPLSTLLPKSLYAIGWIYENRLGENRQAFEVYRQLIEKFPNSDFAKDLRVKIAAAEKQFKSAELQKSTGTNAAATVLGDAAGLNAAANDSARAKAELDEREKAKAELQRRLLEGEEDLPIRKPPKQDNDKPDLEQE